MFAVFHQFVMFGAGDQGEARYGIGGDQKEMGPEEDGGEGGTAGEEGALGEGWVRGEMVVRDYGSEGMCDNIETNYGVYTRQLSTNGKHLNLAGLYARAH